MPMEVDRRQFLQLAGANVAALALGPVGAGAPGRSEKVGQTQTDIELFDVQCGFGGMTPGDPKVVSVEELVTEMARPRIGAVMDRVGVRSMICSHLQCMGADCARGHREVLAAMRAFPGRILGY